MVRGPTSSVLERERRDIANQDIGWIRGPGFTPSPLPDCRRAKGRDVQSLPITEETSAVGLSSVKEVHFFDDESLDWSKPPYDRYHSYFPKRRRAIAWGEATPIYSYWPNALERIKAYRPDMKLVLLFRDPISRAYSAWSHQRRKGREPLTFAKAIRQGRDRVSDLPDIANRHFSYVERGFYGEQLNRCLELFPKSNILSLDFRQLSVDPSGLLQRVSSFLGIPAPTGPTDAIQANAGSTDTFEESPSAEDVELLVDAFASDLKRFSDLVEFSIDKWPTVEVMRGRAAPQDVALQLANRGLASSNQSRKKRESHQLVISAAILTKRVAAAVRRYARRGQFANR